MKFSIDILGSSACAVALALTTTLAFAAQGPAPADTPAGPGEFRQQLGHELQKSDSPRDWALGAQLLETDPPSGANLRERLVILRKAAVAAPDDRIVQSLWADIALDPHCTARMACGNPPARIRLEPDNGAAWLPVIERAWQADNPRGVDAGIARLASSSRYNEHFGEAIAAWRDVLRRHQPPKSQRADRTAEEFHVLGLAYAEATTTAEPTAAPLIDACSKAKHPDAGAKRLHDCARSGRLMMARSQTLGGRAIGVAVLRASQEGVPADVERVRTVTWQVELWQQLNSDIASDPVLLQNFMNLIQANDSEMAALRYELTIFGKQMTPPPDWKQTVEGRPVEPLDDTLPPKP